MRYAWMLSLVALLLLCGCMGGGGDADPAAEATSTATEVVATTATPARTQAAQTATVTVTATTTASPAAELCPIAADACSFAAQIAQRVLAGDGDGVLSSSQSTFYECPGPDGGLGDPFPLCNGAAAGEIRAGFPLRRIQSEAGAISEADAEILIAEWSARTEPSLSDEYGNGEARAYTIACTDAQNCEDRFSLVFSGLAPGSGGAQGALRTMLVVDAQRNEDGDLRADGFATGVLTFGLHYALRGGTGSSGDPDVPAVLAPPPLGWSSVTFFPWDPSLLIQ